MDFRSLQYFVTVAQELNFTRAAERLNMSQPPLSNQIRDMEIDLGTQLFIRGKRHLQLTEAGQILYRRSLQILELSEKTRMDITSLGQELSGRLTLGTVEGRAPFLAARWIAGFRDEFPLVTFHIRNGSSDDVIDQLYRGVIDLAIIAAPYDREHLNGITVGTFPWIALIPKNHPLALREGDSIPLADLAGEPLIIPERRSRAQAIERWFSSIGKEPTVIASLSSYLDAVALVEQNIGIAIFPQTASAPNPDVEEKIITDPTKIARFVLVRSKAQEPSGLVQAFLDYVQDFMDEDMAHSERFKNARDDYDIPEDADLL